MGVNDFVLAPVPLVPNKRDEGVLLLFTVDDLFKLVSRLLDPVSPNPERPDLSGRRYGAFWVDLNFRAISFGVPGLPFRNWGTDLEGFIPTLFFLLNLPTLNSKPENPTSLLSLERLPLPISFGILKHGTERTE